MASGGPTEKVQWEQNVATVHPSGTQLTDIHVGPSLSGDAWPRLADRLAQKAGQTSGGPPAWIRVEVDYSLFALTSLASLEPAARLRALARNVAIALVDAPHVLGVVLGPPRAIGAGDDERLLPSAEDPTRSGLVLPTPVFRERAAASGPTAVRCALPGGWARTTFVLPNPACDAEDPLRPGTVLAAEGGWLDWALDRLGMPDDGSARPLTACPDWLSTTGTVHPTSENDSSCRSSGGTQPPGDYERLKRKTNNLAEASFWCSFRFDVTPAPLVAKPKRWISNCVSHFLSFKRQLVCALVITACA